MYAKENGVPVHIPVESHVRREFYRHHVETWRLSGNPFRRPRWPAEGRYHWLPV